MRIYHEALWDLPVVEAVYEKQYWEYYGEKFDWEEITTRELEEPSIKIYYDEQGNQKEFYFPGGSYLRTLWRPREKRSKGRRRLEKEA